MKEPRWLDSQILEAFFLSVSYNRVISVEINIKKLSCFLFSKHSFVSADREFRVVSDSLRDGNKSTQVQLASYLTDIKFQFFKFFCALVSENPLQLFVFAT